MKIITKRKGFQMLKELYKEYCEELDKYDITGRTYPENQAENVFDRYKSDRFFEIKPVIYTGCVVGFLIVGSEYSRHLHIYEAYIKPGFRRHGILRREIAELLNGKHMVVFEIFDKNEPAKKAWAQLMKENRFSLVGKNNIDRGLTEYFYCR